jgi:methyl-accepting chemotaxis protein
MTALKQIHRIYEELKDSIEFFENQLKTGTRLEMIESNVAEIIEMIESLLLDPRISSTTLSSFEELRMRALDIQRRVRNMLSRMEEDISNEGEVFKDRKWRRWRTY